MKPSFDIRRFLLLAVLAACLMPADRAFAKNEGPGVRPLPRVASGITVRLPAARLAPGSFVPGKRAPLAHLRLLYRQPGKAGRVIDVYAAMEWEFSSFYEDPYTYYEYLNYYIRYYSDAGGTTPLALPSDLTVYFQWNYAGSDGYFHSRDVAQSIQGDYQYEIPDVLAYYTSGDDWAERVLTVLDGAGYTAIN